MALGGGHWVWTAVLRYLFTIFIVATWLVVSKDFRYLVQVGRVFLRYPIFWIVVGSFACGLFYTGIAFSSTYLRGWVVAATWQITVLASPIVMFLFGYRFPKRGFVFSLVVLVGVACINWEFGIENASSNIAMAGIFALVISAFAYPIGNQLLNSAKNGGLAYVPHIKSDVLNNAFAAILLMALGSIPFGAVLLAITQPPMPSFDQYVQTFFVALFAGVLATAVFLYARNKTSKPFMIIAIDTTQSAEVLFALAFELMFINPAVPSVYQIIGVVIVGLGLSGYCLWTVPAKNPVEHS